MIKKFTKCSKRCSLCKGVGEIVIPELSTINPSSTSFRVELCPKGSWVEEKFNKQGNLVYRKYKNKNNKCESPNIKTPAVETFFYNGTIYIREFRKNGRLHSPNSKTPSSEIYDYNERIAIRQFHKYGKFHSPNEITPGYERFDRDSGRSRVKLFYKHGLLTREEREN